MPRIKLTLSASGIDDAIQQIQEYADKVESASEKIVESLAKDGAEIAADYAMFSNAYDSGELVAGIVPEVDGNKGRIHSTAPHSAFVEMGTGIKGADSPHPSGAYPGWDYDQNHHGEAGWEYIGADGKKHWTQGMPSRPFMYATGQDLHEAVPDYVKGVLHSD